MNLTNLARAYLVVSSSSAGQASVRITLVAAVLLFLSQFCFAFASSGATASSQIYITEVMALNRKTVLDEDRHPSDWIELYNAGAAAVDLNGWFLTDSASQLQKWSFPETHVGPGEYLLVFASGKNRRQAGHELHSNFKLDTGGEYLALVKPDGRSIAMEFKPKFPALRPDVSYGIPLSEQVQRLISSDALKWVLVPTQDPGVEWRTSDFKAVGWDVGKGGIGFDAGTNLLPWIGADIGPKMKGHSSSLLVRVPFVITNAEVGRMAMRMYYDDGFVAWLNGTEIARRNAPEKAQWNSIASKARSTAEPVGWVEDFEGEESTFALTNGDPGGKSRLSISNPDTNHFLRLVNGRLPEQLNAVAFPQALPGASRSLKLQFDFRVKGGGTLGNDLYVALIPSKDFGVRGQGAPLSSFRGREVDLKGGLVAHMELYPSGRDAMLYLFWNGEKKQEISLRDTSLGGRFYHKAALSVNFVSEGARVSLKVTTDVRGGTGHEVVLADQVLVPGVMPYPSRLQIVGHSRANLVTMDLDNLKADWTPAGENLSEDFDLTAFRSALRTGTNVLAVLGLNRSADDADFVILPELYTFTTRLQVNAPRYFSPATPLAANNDEGYPSVAPSPVISPKGMVLGGSARVTMASSLSGGAIRYTTNGREPTESSDLYSAPIDINTTTVLKASTFAPGVLPSPAAMETYTSVDPDLLDFSSNLPILLLNPQGRVHSESRKTPVSARLIDPGSGRATLKGEPQYEGRGDMNLRGFSSLRYPKRSYTFRLRDEYGEKLKSPLAGMPKDSDWVLLAPYPDKTLMRDVLAYELSRAMGHYAPRTRFIELFLNNSGGSISSRSYQGVYVLVEKIKRGKNRVDIEELGPSDNDEKSITGGYIFKRDHSNKESPTFFTRGGEFFLVEPQPEEATPQQREWLERHFKELERSIYGKNFADPERGYQKYLDVPSFIDQHWLIEMSKNVDGFRYSVFFSKDRGGKVKLEPVWDWNLSFGNANYLDGESTRGWYYEQLRDSEISWVRRLTEDPEFNQRQIDRWWELRRGPLQTDAVLRRVDQIAAQLQEAQNRNFKRWPVLGVFVHPNSFVGDSYREEVDWMKKWIRDRMAWIDSQIPGPPSINCKSDHGETRATIKGRSGTTYYTLDGSDPRQARGEPSASAKVYQGPVSVGVAAKVIARTRGSDSWSPPAVWNASGTQ